MRRLIALLALLTALTACGAAPEQAEGPEDVPMTELAPAVSADSGALRDQAVFAQAAPEPLSYTVELETLEDSTLSESGTELVRRSYQLPVMTVTAADGSLLTEADTLDEAAALEAAEAFNSQFTDWAAADGLDEMAAIAEEDRIFRTESGFPWNPHFLELTCSAYQTEQMVSVRGEYYTFTGGAHPNTVLLSWNFDLTTGQFFSPEQLAADGEAFSQAVTAELLRQSRETAAENGMTPEEFFWTDYQDILVSWGSYAVSFDETGMTVAFSPYELAAYAAGAQVYHLDYGRFAGTLSPHGLALLGLAAVEK